MKNVKFTGQLYQFSTKNPMQAGQYVAINGPWDTFGAIVTSKPEAEGSHLNLIRGCRAQQGVRPAASF